MFTPTQLDIIRVFGKKELTEGCLVYIGEQIILRLLYFNPRFITFHEGTYHIDDKKYIPETIKSVIKFSEVPAKEIEILGHISHLEDVFRLANEKGWDVAVSERELAIRDKVKRGGAVRLMVCPKQHLHCEYNPTLPLLEQPESTLLELLKLFK